MLRRDFLKLIGVAVTAPSLVVKETALAGQKFDGEIIPTGFPIIDEAIGGGIRRRGLHTIHGDEPQMFGESLAMRIGEKASVALLTPFNHCCNPSFSSYHGDVFVFPMSQPVFSPSMVCNTMRTHDVIVILNDFLFDHHDIRVMRMMADQENCSLIWVSFARTRPRRSTTGLYENVCGDLIPFSTAFSSDVILCVESQGTTDREAVQWDDQFQYSFGRLHTLCVTKNRWGKNHVVEPIILNDGIGFRPMEETAYWEYDRKTGVIMGPWGKHYGNMVRPSINEKPIIRRCLV